MTCDRVEDRRQGVAQLVGEHREELVLAAVGLGELLGLPAQLLLQPLALGHVAERGEQGAAGPPIRSRRPASRRRGPRPPARGMSISVVSPGTTGMPKTRPTRSSAGRPRSSRRRGWRTRYAVAADDDHAVGVRLDHVAEPRLAVAQGLLAGALASDLRGRRQLTHRYILPSRSLALGQPCPRAIVPIVRPAAAGPTWGTGPRGCPRRSRKGSPTCIPRPSMVNSRISLSCTEPRILSTVSPRRISPNIST